MGWLPDGSIVVTAPVEVDAFSLTIRLQDGSGQQTLEQELVAVAGAAEGRVVELVAVRARADVVAVEGSVVAWLGQEAVATGTLPGQRLDLSGADAGLLAPVIVAMGSMELPDDAPAALRTARVTMATVPMAVATHPPAVPPLDLSDKLHDVPGAIVTQANHDLVDEAPRDLTVRGEAWEAAHGVVEVTP